jgi:LysM repeat protein
MRLKEFANVASWKTIAARNAIANPDVIKPGQVLDVGDGVVLPKGTTYTVKSGDTLSGIAQNIRKGQIPDTTSSAVQSAQGGPSKPVAAAPVLNKTPATDAELKKRIGADQPIPTYKYDAAKDQAILDKLQKQDQQKQKQLQKVPKQKSNPPKPQPGTTPGSSEFDRIRGIESGNRDYDKKGRPIVSPKGARFAAQVMPKTSGKPGYGVKPATNTSAEEFNRVGRDYFAAMKNRYGNSELAAAAYNAGPGRVDRILQQAKQTGQDWKKLLPRETQDYLEKFKAK